VFSTFALILWVISSKTNGLIKQIIVLVLLLNCGKMVGQKMLPMPVNAQPGKEYWQYMAYDSIHQQDNRGIIPPFGWEAFLIEKIPKHQRFTLSLPVFDTITLKIPVDKSSHMANLPDEYGLITERTVVEEGSLGWNKVKKYKSVCLPANFSDCIYLVYFEIPPQYRKVQKLVLKSTAHQQYYENLDSVEFKQVIEVQPLVKVSIEVPPQYETIFKKQNPHAAYSEWKEMICAVCKRTNETVIKLQKVLQKRGYYHGKLDNILGKETKAALTEFQKVYNFETGSLNIKTLEGLGFYNDEDDD
jgi:hypothetical protein